jgi:hypothetical protein
MWAKGMIEVVGTVRRHRLLARRSEMPIVAFGRLGDPSKVT